MELGPTEANLILSFLIPNHPILYESTTYSIQQQQKTTHYHVTNRMRLQQTTPTPTKQTNDTTIYLLRDLYRTLILGPHTRPLIKCDPYNHCCVNRSEVNSCFGWHYQLHGVLVLQLLDIVHYLIGFCVISYFQSLESVVFWNVL